MKPYTITREDLNAITDAEAAFGTTKFLPDYSQVPSDFKQGNIYTRIAAASFFGDAMPDSSLEFRAGFSDAEAQGAMLKCIRAHLASWQPKHEHKIAGVGYMLSLLCEITPA